MVTLRKAARTGKAKMPQTLRTPERVGKTGTGHLTWPSLYCSIYTGSHEVAFMIPATDGSHVVSLGKIALHPMRKNGSACFAGLG